MNLKGENLLKERKHNKSFKNLLLKYRKQYMNWQGIKLKDSIKKLYKIWLISGLN